MDNKIIKRYTDAKTPGSYLAVSGFLKNNKDLKTQNVEKELAFSDTVTAHKPIRKHFIRNKFTSDGIDDIWQADLVDMSKMKYNNLHFTFLLTCIDIFSKYAWVVPIKSKSGENVRDAFKIILKEGRKPNKIQVDKGNEFKGECKKYLNENNIELYYTYSVIKAGIVERFNRTLKEKMWRMFTERNSKKYVDVLQDLVYSYNHSYHRSIKTTPALVNKNNEKAIRDILYGDISDAVISIDFNVGDYVKINKEKKIFEKGYTENWEKDVYLISQVLPRVPPVYKIKRIDGSELKGVFYKEEIQLINYLPFDTYQVVQEKEGDILIKQLNNSNQTEKWVNKKDFLK